jgi:hypothetical protein
MHYLVPYSLHLSPGQLALGQQSNYLTHKLKVWWYDATLFDIIFINHSHSTIIHSFILHHSPRPVFLYPHRFSAQQETSMGC